MYEVSRLGFKHLYPRCDFGPCSYHQPGYYVFFISDAINKNAKVPCTWRNSDEEACLDQEAKMGLLSNVIRNGVDSLALYIKMKQEEALAKSINQRLDETSTH